MDGCYKFCISDLDFTVNGKIRKDELFECLFQNKDVNDVLDELEDVTNKFSEAFDKYEERGSDTHYEQLEKIYSEAEILCGKLELTINEDNISRSQARRFKQAFETIEEIFYEY